MKVEQWLDELEAGKPGLITSVERRLVAKLREAVKALKLQRSPANYVQCPGCHVIEDMDSQFMHAPGCAAWASFRRLARCWYS